jgi:hypothetical protein
MLGSGPFLKLVQIVVSPDGKRHEHGATNNPFPYLTIVLPQAPVNV